MNAELKAKWIAALRSGEYKQTRKCLKNDHGYCCLGVLAVISDKKIGVDVADGQGLAGYAWFSKAIDGDYGKLAHLNDDGVPFPDIADYIESHL